jgi:hypothetical protein
MNHDEDDACGDRLCTARLGRQLSNPAESTTFFSVGRECAAFNLNLLFSRADVLTITASISSPVIVAALDYRVHQRCHETGVFTDKPLELRKEVAEAIVQCAKNGKTILGALTEAGERALVRLRSPKNRPV